jgi:predicted acylesterase/phospholipase RssA
MYKPMSSWLLAIVGALLIAGCASAPERPLSRETLRYASLPNGHDPLNPDQLVVSESVARASLEEGIIPFFEHRRGHALQILVLSGGGQNGAFGAGFLKGWRERGDRPQFDIVTGVSTGALLATHAFLGTPADDAVLETIFTGVDKSDIYKPRLLLGIFFGNSSLYDTSPLEALLDKYITAETLQRVAAACDQGRRLWVGTTNLDYDQTWVWNLTQIAKDGKIDLYKQVLRASAAPPVAFPPVEIEGHLFADGGVRENIVVVGLAGNQRPPAPRYGPGTVYVIQNGQERSAPAAVRNDLLDIAGGSLDVMMTSSMDSMMLRAYVAARAHGYRFLTVAVPDDVDIGTNSLAFDPTQMRTGFDAGLALTRQPDPWSRAPAFIDDLPPWALDLISAPR